MENERAENIMLGSSPQLAACPGKQTVAGGNGEVLLEISFANCTILFLIRSCQT